ncbi:hypothetical protein J3R30DRAFT_2111700 [Lentinula aciculospora]|uniref:Uncharacterized protein n=1 Tax=Lentinula aciculospora TaxID=153920 RepID=A0A9W9AHX0_9AGAR|nr:hypothetical protein J3R30DRAFT_2111700 [Lentinula aciculospora]
MLNTLSNLWSFTLSVFTSLATATDPKELLKLCQKVKLLFLSRILPFSFLDIIRFFGYAIGVLWKSLADIPAKLASIPIHPGAGRNDTSPFTLNNAPHTPYT